MSALTGQTKASTYDSLLHITDNGPAGGTEKVVADGVGNDTALKVGTGGISSVGTIGATGAISTTAGGNAVSSSVASTAEVFHTVSNTAGTVLTGVTTAGVGYVGTFTPDAFRVYSDSAVVGEFSSTGLAVTGAVSATGGIDSTTIGGTTPAAGVFTTLTSPFVKQSTGNVRTASTYTATATTSLSNVTGLSVTLTSGQNYTFSAVLYGTQTSTGGYAFGLGGTCTASTLIGDYRIKAEAAAEVTGGVTALGTVGAVNSAGALTMAQIRGYIVCSGTGTFTIQFGQFSATGASTIAIGSHLHVTQY